MDNITKLIKENLEKFANRTLVLKKKVDISEELEYHINENLTLTNNVFMVYSKRYFDLINEVRDLWTRDLIHLNEEDEQMVMSDTGKVALFEGEMVYLDAPVLEDDDYMNEAEHRGKKVNLNKPFRTPGGPKKFAVYVKTPGGGVKKVTFGDPNLRVRNKNKGAAKSFRARHKCDQKKDRTTAGYWSCNVGRYSKQLGLKSSNSW